MSKINAITQNYDRSTDSGKAAIEAELQGAPIGSMPGDPVPGLSYRRPGSQAVYFARNISNQVEREVTTATLSAIGVVSEELKKKFSLDGEAIKDRVNRGLLPANITDLKLEVIDKVFRYDGKSYLIPASRTKGEAGPWVPIPEGVWDLLLGNYDIIHGKDEFSRRDEMTQLAGRWGGKCVAFAEGTERKPWQYVELKREEISEAPVAADREKVYPGGIAVEI